MDWAGAPTGLDGTDEALGNAEWPEPVQKMRSARLKSDASGAEAWPEVGARFEDVGRRRRTMTTRNALRTGACSLVYESGPMDRCSKLFAAA